MTLKRTSRVRPPQGDEGCRRRPWAICPVEATSSLTDGALSPDLPTSPSSLSSVSHLSCRGLILIIWWGGCVIISTLSLSLSLSTGHLSCRGLVAVVVQWGPPPHHPRVFCPVEASSPSLSLSVLATLSSSSGSLLLLASPC